MGWGGGSSPPDVASSPNETKGFVEITRQFVIEYVALELQSSSWFQSGSETV